MLPCLYISICLVQSGWPSEQLVEWLWLRALLMGIWGTRFVPHTGQEEETLKYASLHSSRA